MTLESILEDFYLHSAFSTPHKTPLQKKMTKEKIEKYLRRHEMLIGSTVTLMTPTDENDHTKNNKKVKIPGISAKWWKNEYGKVVIATCGPLDFSSRIHTEHCEESTVTRSLSTGYFKPFAVELAETKKRLSIGDRFEGKHVAGILIVREFLLTPEGPVVLFSREGFSNQNVYSQNRVLLRNIATIL